MRLLEVDGLTRAQRTDSPDAFNGALSPRASKAEVTPRGVSNSLLAEGKIFDSMAGGRGGKPSWSVSLAAEYGV